MVERIQNYSITALTTRSFFFSVVFFLLCSGFYELWAHSGRTQCSFQQMAEYMNSNRNQAARVVMSQASNFCTPDDFHDSVYTDTTENFRIYYTLTGPHRIRDWESGTASSYLAQIKNDLEEAWSLHTGLLGMRNPQGLESSYHFEQTSFSDKYPVEVVDLSLMREGWRFFAGGYCQGCYGVTLPDITLNTGKSTLLLENDFVYRGAGGDTVQYLLPDNSTCNYIESSDTLFSEDRTINYYENWLPALQPTVFHELYHGVQISYRDFRDFGLFVPFWFEASATGVEAFAVPQSQDYFQYLSATLTNTDISLTNTSGTRAYGQAPFYLFLNHHLGTDFDHTFWQRISTSEADPISWTLRSMVEGDYNWPLDSLFHQYALELLFSGQPESPWEFIHPHQPDWPLVKTVSGSELVPYSGATDLDLDYLSWRVYDFRSEGDPLTAFSLAELLNTPGYKLSALQKTGMDWTITPIQSRDDISSSTDYIVVSNGQVYDEVDYALENEDLYRGAFPNPVRPADQLCFSAGNNSQLPKIRLFSTGGEIVRTFERPGAHTRCFRPENASGRPLAGGVYYYQFADENKLRKLIVLE